MSIKMVVRSPKGLFNSQSKQLKSIEVDQSSIEVKLKSIELELEADRSQSKAFKLPR